MPLSLTAHHTLPSMTQPGSRGPLPMPSNLRCANMLRGHASKCSMLSETIYEVLDSDPESLLYQVWDVSAVSAAADEGASSEQPAQLRSTAVVAAHDKDINALAVSPNDALICTASQDRTAKVRPPEQQEAVFCCFPVLMRSRHRHAAVSCWSQFYIYLL